MQPRRGTATDAPEVRAVIDVMREEDAEIWMRSGRL
jgi:hypothetical protein